MKREHGMNPDAQIRELTCPKCKTQFYALLFATPSMIYCPYCGYDFGEVSISVQT